MSASERVAVVWERGPVKGEIEVVYGRLASPDASFSLPATNGNRLLLEIGDARVSDGARATRVTVRATEHPFTFFLRDVSAEHPVYLPQFGAAVTAAGDERCYREIAGAVEGRGLRGELEAIESEPEESYESAVARTRDLQCPTWLGLGRDMRIFEFEVSRKEGYWGGILPRFHGRTVVVPECVDGKNLRYTFVLGRGAACEADMSRRLEDGCLPILRGGMDDGDVRYELTAFVTGETAPLRADTVRGTHYLVADGHAGGHMFTEEQRARYEELLPGELDREETVLHLRATATNTASVPRYAWFRKPCPDAGNVCATRHEPETGFGVFETGRVFTACRLNGRPMAELEAAVLVKPGESAAFEFVLPHRPVSRERVGKLAACDFDARLEECRAYWRGKLEAAAAVDLPERRVNEMVKAGLLHLDLVAYGLEPDGTLAPTIGWYAPIGSESTPIILFFESMGLHDIARRSIQFFLDKQHEDGFVQNFGGYMLETGCALNLIAEHFLYTRDVEWLRSVAPGAMKSVRYLTDWRRRNMRDDLRGRGYGMIDGKVADPEDPFHYFMNSGYAYLGLKRTAEWLALLDPDEAKTLAEEAEAFRRDIRAELAECMARSPVIPVGDGSWCPTAPPWAEATGASSMLSDGEPCFSHHTFACRDSLIGPLWLVFQQVVEPDEPMGEALLASHAVLHTLHNVAFSQPYYSRHDYAHLARGEVNAFLKTFYNGFSGLADRQTYTWWEHYFHASVHKTHEEGWFLMQIRWMLLMEKGTELRLLPGIPRAWLRNGRRVAFENMGSHFGAVSLRVESKLAGGTIEAGYSLTAGRLPEKLTLRIPHPEGLRATVVEGGTYDAGAETVEIAGPGAEGSVTLRW